MPIVHFLPGCYIREIDGIHGPIIIDIIPFTECKIESLDEEIKCIQEKQVQIQE